MKIKRLRLNFIGEIFLKTIIVISTLVMILGIIFLCTKLTDLNKFEGRLFTQEQLVSEFGGAPIINCLTTSSKDIFYCNRVVDDFNQSFKIFGNNVRVTSLSSESGFTFEFRSIKYMHGDSSRSEAEFNSFMLYMATIIMVIIAISFGVYFYNKI
jgi:hypothetical protein